MITGGELIDAHSDLSWKGLSLAIQVPLRPSLLPKGDFAEGKANHFFSRVLSAMGVELQLCIKSEIYRSSIEGFVRKRQSLDS